MNYKIATFTFLSILSLLSKSDLVLIDDFEESEADIRTIQEISNYRSCKVI